MEKLNNNLIIVLSKKLSKFNLNFYQEFKKKYHIRVLFVNDENTSLSKNCIYITDEDCLRYKIRKFTHSTEKEITSWDRAIAFLNFYYLDHFKFVWFVEEDVYIKSEKIFIDLIKKYESQNIDLLTNHISDMVLYPKWSNWELIKDQDFIKKHKSFNCFSRLSKKLIKKIGLYAIKNKNFKSLFHELSFINICLKEKMIAKTFDLNDGFLIRWRPNINKQELLMNYNIYHPVKNIKSLLIKY